MLMTHDLTPQCEKYAEDSYVYEILSVSVIHLSGLYVVVYLQ